MDPVLKFPKVNGDDTRDINQLLPTIRLLVLAALYECKELGYFLGISETWRNPVAQHRDFISGKSKLDSGFGTHEYRVSVDTFTVLKKHKESYHKPTMLAASKVFKKWGAIWGGDWDNDGDLKDNKFNDWPHYQFVTLEEQKILYKLKKPELIEKWLQKKFTKQLAIIKKEGKIK